MLLKTDGDAPANRLACGPTTRNGKIEKETGGLVSTCESEHYLFEYARIEIHETNIYYYLP